MAILYKANETDFNHLGLGPLNDATSLLVTEERNGLFELEMKYPVDGAQFDELKMDRLIKADAGHGLKNQRFKVIRITKPMDGIVTVYGEHVSYLTQDLALKPTVNYNGSATNALNAWKNSIADVHPFTVSSDIATTGKGSWSIKDVKNARQALGGVRGSLLDTYGGEYLFDNYNIRLMAQRGVNSGALIAYGRNLTDLTQEETIAETYTSIYPYSVYQDDNNNEVLLTLPEYFIDSEYVGNYARRKILPVNFSSDEIKTESALRSRTQSYITANNVGVPKVNMKIKYADLANTLDYQNMKVLEEVNVCDNVPIYFEKFDINTTAKVIKTVWDDLLKQYDSIEVGEARAGLSKSINTTVDGKLETVVQRLNSVQLSADSKNIIYRGPETPPPGNIGDLWYEPDGQYENMYQWDGAIWKLVVSTRDLQILKNQVTEIIAQADADRLKTEQDIANAIDTAKAYTDQLNTQWNERFNSETTSIRSEINTSYEKAVADSKSFVLSADVITSTQLKVDNALIDKFTANTAALDHLFANEAYVDRLNTKTLNAITANIDTVRAEILTAEVITSTHIKSDTALVDKIFATDANVNTLTSKTAFIDSIKAVEISADKVTGGTLNFANINGINLNASNITTGVLTGIELRAVTITSSLVRTMQIAGVNSEIYFENLSNGSKINYADNSIRFQRDSYTYYRVNQGGSNGSQAVDSKFLHQFYGAGEAMFSFGRVGSHTMLTSNRAMLKFSGTYDEVQVRNAFDSAYVDFRVNDVNSRYIYARSIFSQYNTSRRMLNDFENGNVSVNAVGGSLYLGYEQTNRIYANATLDTLGNDIVTRNIVLEGGTVTGNQQNLIIRTNVSSSIVYLQANYEVRATTPGAASYITMRASNFSVETSLRENKTNIELFDEDVLSRIRNINGYRYHVKGKEDSPYKQLGLMIDETPRAIHGEAGDSIEMYSLGTYALMGVKQLEESTNKRITDLEVENQMLKERIRKLEVA